MDNKVCIYGTNKSSRCICAQVNNADTLYTCGVMSGTLVYCFYPLALSRLHRRRVTVS
jgi:hypothetical protein